MNTATLSHYGTCSLGEEWEGEKEREGEEERESEGGEWEREGRGERRGILSKKEGAVEEKSTLK